MDYWKRIDIEDNFTRQKFPSFVRYSDFLGYPYWQGTMFTNSNKCYIIRVEVSADFPLLRPKLYITSPCPLYTFWGKKLADLGATQYMHTYGPKNGWVQMCVCRDECWSSDDSIFKCLKKARVWIEAYDAHLRTGKNMDKIVGHQELWDN